MGESLEQTEYPRCGAMILHLNVEGPACGCGWDLDVDHRDGLRMLAAAQGADFGELFEGFDGDLEALGGFLRAIARDWDRPRN
jgi:hypothetical protein